MRDGHLHRGVDLYAGGLRGIEKPGTNAAIDGDDGANELIGTEDDDTIHGFGGNDGLQGLGGNDFLYGGDGHDHVIGDAGRDILHGKTGGDGLYGGGGGDVLRGGGGSDLLHGFNGHDLLNGGTGADRYEYFFGQSAGAKESTGAKFDTIVAPDFAGVDRFELFRYAAKGDLFAYSPDAIDAPIVGGALSRATFDADLEAAVDADAMARLHAVLFQPDAGDFAGQVFLIIDTNFDDGYQAQRDLVIRLANPQHLDAFGLDDFLPGQ